MANDEFMELQCRNAVLQQHVLNYKYSTLINSTEL